MTQLTFIAYDTIFTQTAHNLNWRLQKIIGAAKVTLSHGTTKKNGEPKTNMLPKNEELNGTYELHLSLAEYFEKQGWELPNPPLLDEVSFRFQIEDKKHDYQMHIQITPHSYDFCINKKIRNKAKN